jgi:hypothetical protein
VDGLMFITLQISEAGGLRRAVVGLYLGLHRVLCEPYWECSGVFWLGCKHPLKIAFNWTQKAALSHTQGLLIWRLFDH